MGMPGSTNMTLTVPVWMPAELEGMSLDVVAEAMRGALKVGSMNGDITVRNGGDLDISVMNGDLIVEGGDGRLTLNTVSGEITATGARGDITAAAISGNIGLYRIESSRVIAESVSGEVVYQGTIQNGGSYVMSTHSGSVTFGMPANANATVNSSSMSGSLTASFSLPSVEERSRSRRTVRFGTGSARIDLETFNGRIRLVRPDEVPSQQRRREGRSQHDRFESDAWQGELDLALDVLRDLDLSGLASLANIGVRVAVTPELIPEFDWAFDMRFLRNPNLDLNLRRVRSRSEPPSPRLEY
jgi:DUF4097 and DUF4098 domain-containing protein YvlB